MKKKKLLQIPPIELRKSMKTYYRLVAGIYQIDGEDHLICDIYQRDVGGLKYEYIMRAAYTEHDWALYYTERKIWSRSSIQNVYGAPVYDQCGMITGPNIPNKAGWKNTTPDEESITIMSAFWKAHGSGWADRKDWQRYLITLENGIKSERYDKEQASRQDKLQKRIEDMPKIPEDFNEWADKEIFHNKEYVYYKRKGRWAECTCSKCGSAYKILIRRPPTLEGQCMDVRPVPQNNAYTTCEECGTAAVYKPAGRARYTYGIIETAYLIQPFRGRGTVIRYFQMHKEWSLGDKSYVYPVEIGRAFFTAKKIQTDWHLRDNWNGTTGWYDHNIGGLQNLGMKPGAVYMKNVKEWKTLALRYSGLKEYIMNSGGIIRPSRYLEAAEHCPLEKIVKMGLMGLAEELIEAGYASRTTAAKLLGNMYAKKADDLLGIRPCRLGMLRSNGGSTELLKIMQIERKNTEAAIAGECQGKGEWTVEQIIKLTNLKVDKEQVLHALDYMSVTKLINRIEKYAGGNIPETIDGWKCENRQRHFHETAQLYLDYIKLRVRGGYGMERSTDVAPKNLEEAHREVVLANNKKENEIRAAEYDKKFPMVKKQFRALKRKYGWKHEGLFIRPAKCPKEFIEEGQILHHCVGSSSTYISRHNNGDSFILFLRSTTAPNEPYVTVEVQGTHICQWFGRNDTKPDAEKVDLWLSEWKKEVKSRMEKEASAATVVDAEGVLIAAG